MQLFMLAKPTFGRRPDACGAGQLEFEHIDSRVPGARANLLGHAFGLYDIPGRQGHAGPTGGKGSGRFRTQPPGGPGDESDTPLEVEPAGHLLRGRLRSMRIPISQTHRLPFATPLDVPPAVGSMAYGGSLP